MVDRFVVIFTVFIFCTFCGTALAGEENPGDPGIPFQIVVDRLSILTKDLKPPFHLFDENALKNGSEFDPMTFFDILKNISLKGGKVLDYVYLFQGSAGHPILYVRDKGEEPYSNLKVFREGSGNKDLDRETMFMKVMEHLEVKDTPEGYFEYAVFFLKAQDFYLYKWAERDMRIVCTWDAFERIMNEDSQVSAEKKSRDADINFSPRISLSPEKAEIRLVICESCHGFYEERLSVSRVFPHKLVGHEKVELVVWKCGVIF